MSAICGVIHFNGKEVSEETEFKMRKELNRYPMDQVKVLRIHNICMCCGLQYITEESLEEDVPVYEKDDNCYYVADCMIDNRKELISLLHIEDNKIVDSRLLYLAYKKWQDKIGEYVCGVFSFAIYDATSMEIVLFTDHTSSRCLYYMYQESLLYFSTTIGPIISASGISRINEKFITLCLSTISPNMTIIPGLTAFQGVNQILAGHYIKVNLYSLKQISYWDPFRAKQEYHKLKETEFRESFLDLFTTCVKGLLRSVGETGITLSSGLDSSSVACIALKLLQEEKKNLYSFTSIPSKTYVNDEAECYIVDESNGPLEIQKEYSNLIPTLLSCEGKDAFKDMEYIVGQMEFPYKSGQNMVWLEEIYNKAVELNVKVILKGQYGNATISYGNIMTLVLDSLYKLKLLKAYREFKDFANLNQVHKKAAIRGCANAVRSRFFYDYSSMDNTIVRKSLFKKFHVKREIRRIVRHSGGTIMDTSKERYNFIYCYQALAQLGAYDTKFGLMHRLIIRDPCKDKRMLEFCAAVPIECFVHNGMERAMVRDYMQGVVPQVLLTNVRRRGLQSADFVHRIKSNWNEIYEKGISVFSNQKLTYYCEEERMLKLKQLWSKEKPPESQDVIIQIMHLYSVSMFLNIYNRE